MSQMSHLIELADIGQTIHHDRQNLKQQVEKCLKKKKCESVNIFFKIPYRIVKFHQSLGLLKAPENCLG